MTTMTLAPFDSGLIDRAQAREEKVNTRSRTEERRSSEKRRFKTMKEHRKLLAVGKTAFERSFPISYKVRFILIIFCLIILREDYRLGALVI